MEKVLQICDGVVHDALLDGELVYFAEHLTSKGIPDCRRLCDGILVDRSKGYAYLTNYALYDRDKENVAIHIRRQIGELRSQISELEAELVSLYLE